MINNYNYYVAQSCARDGMYAKVQEMAVAGHDIFTDTCGGFGETTFVKIKCETGLGNELWVAVPIREFESMMKEFLGQSIAAMLRGDKMECLVDFWWEEEEIVEDDHGFYPVCTGTAIWA